MDSTMPIIKPSPRPQVRVGLSKNQKPAPLHKQFREKAKEPESITAPPLSSDEEAAYDRARGDSSDDDEDEPPRGQIVPTVFNSTSNPRRSTREKVNPSSQGKKITSSYQTDESSGSARSKRPAEESRGDSHFTDELGFTKKQKLSGRKRAATYGSKSSSQARSSQPKGSQKSAPRSSAAESPAKKTFVGHDSSLSPERARPPQFKMYRDITPEKKTPARSFTKPPSAGSSPESRQKVTFRHGSAVTDDSPEKPKFKRLNVEGEPEIEKPNSTNGKRATRQTRARTKTRKRQDSPQIAEEEFTQRPTFKMHMLDESDDSGDGGAKVVILSESKITDHEEGEGEEEDIDLRSRATGPAQCPMCHEAVDPELLAKHSDRGRMNIRKQTAFCRLHKRKTALTTGDEKGYPKIEWGEPLDARFGAHEAFLRDVLEGARPSHYADVLRQKVEAGKERTLLKTEDSLTPGYYGPRGLRAMTEFIMRALAAVVRKRAVEDRLVSARGYTGYVQAVLVPELAVRLIAEDMRVGEEEARKVMRESIEYGELMYEDVGDVITGVSDEEEGF
ncbi:hypothetical protein F5B20DRAFT_548621 [Whalleya microplaca]|nr:hypothetical protein F5B20DRAFT_548621 [Whalleya microplaca]